MITKMSAKQRSDDYLIEKIDKAVNELVFNKWKLQKAYNYYNGKRDAEQFRYLEENFGIGNPTSIEFTPLIKKHVDALIGEYLDIPILPKVSCKDKETISKITRQKELEISQQVYTFLQKHLNNQILAFIGGGNVSDASVEADIEKLIEDINNNFISDYEIAAQNVIEYVIQSRNTDLANKLKALLLDLLVTGCSFYKVKPSASGTNISIDVLNPLNTFVDRNPESPYVKDSYRVVIRKWMTKQQILIEYNKKYKEKVDGTKISDVQELSGRGMSAVVDSKNVLVGNQKLMEERKIQYVQSTDIGTVLYVAVDGEFVGYIVISDKIKSDSKDAIIELKKNEVNKTVMLTGDKKAVANSVAKELQIDEVYAELLPDGKVEKVEQLLKSKSLKGKLVFVGDGINDAPVLALSDIGIAMGALGSDAAIEAADVVIMTDEPSKVGKAIEISKKTMKIVKENIIFAIAVKVIVLVLGACGVATMWEAVFADVGVSILAILNSLRMLRG